MSDYPPSFASTSSGFAQPSSVSVPSVDEVNELRVTVSALGEEVSALRRLLEQAAYDALAHGHSFEGELLAVLNPDRYRSTQRGFLR